jgi:hypothetical protein
VCVVAGKVIVEIAQRGRAGFVEPSGEELPVLYSSEISAMLVAIPVMIQTMPVSRSNLRVRPCVIMRRSFQMREFPFRAFLAVSEVRVEFEMRTAIASPAGGR